MSSPPRQLRPVQPVRAPNQPAGLSDEAAKLWKRVHKDYELLPHHQVVFERALRALDRALQAEHELAAHGSVTFVDRWEQPRPRPEVKIAHDSAALFTRLLVSLDLDADLARAQFVPRRR
jgi:hypothetical protein